MNVAKEGESKGEREKEVVACMEEAIYVDSLLARAATVGGEGDNFPSPSLPPSAAAGYLRGSLASLLNAAYAPLPPTLPAVICAVGSVLR